ncbi:MAG: hypothetical protein M1833_000083 [Piccolia ochrophora]|nr:MAG: hypothetical protein M1833_000083 [Piccolia ochrophora]
MLLAPAVPCDARSLLPRPSYLPPSAHRTTPPPSDEEDTSTLGNGLFNTCKALQSMLMAQPPTPGRRTPKLISPPLASPIALPVSHTPTTQQLRVQKRLPRGLNKRRRESEDGSSSDDDDHLFGQMLHEDPRFSTPKRPRLAPSTLPFGVTRSDLQGLENTSDAPREMPPTEQDEWSPEDDRVLVELVLEKLKLSRGDWVDCARTLGKDRGSVGRRWKSLVGEGSVGLRGRRKARPKLDLSMFSR